MKNYIQKIITIIMNDKRGVTALEYAVIAAGIVIVVAAAVALLAPKLTTTLASVGSAM
jgi:Flp pilus assembly pilin Flp